MIRRKNSKKKGENMTRWSTFRKIICIFIILLSITTYTQASQIKWGNIAVLQTQKKYPKAEVIDYAYIGKKKYPHHIVQEKFKLWLKSNQKEFGVYVTISVH